jgi:poly(A) polymerase
VFTATDNHIGITDKLGDLFAQEGYELYLVGGSVRDVIMGREPSDLDFATNALPETIKDILRSKLDVVSLAQPKVEALWGIGEQFGTIGAIIEGTQVEITTYRAEQYRQNDRKPHVVFGRTIEEDLARRDFTINAIAMNTQAPERYNLVDPYYGQKDITSQTVKFVGHPKARIMEDPLRMLRAVRFTATLNFHMTAETKFWIDSQSYMIRNISNERVQEELNKMLMSKSPSYSIRTLHNVGMLWVILPEIAKLMNVPQDSRWHFGNVFEHTMEVLDNSSHLLEQRLAALFHDCGKAETIDYSDDKISFHKHEKVGGAIASSAMRRLKYSNTTRGRVVHMVKMHMRPLSLVNSGMSKKAVRKFIRDCYDNKYGVGVADILMLNRADILGHKHPQLDEFYALQEAIAEEQEVAPIQDLDSPLDGNEIMALYPHLEPGPWIGEAKRTLTDAVVAGTIPPGDKDMARDLLFQGVYR